MNKEELLYQIATKNNELIEKNIKIIELQDETIELQERIQDALGIANERINYYFHINNEEVLKDWEEIFDILKGEENE